MLTAGAGAMQCRNMRAVQSMGAGVDFLVKHPGLPDHVPLLRITDEVWSLGFAP